MSGITNVFRRFFTTRIEMPPLGRWKPEYGQSMFDRIDRANMDHCGTCNYSQFLKETKHENKQKQNKRSL